jgi:hypothetical protein
MSASTWLLGFTMGCLTIMAGEKIADNMEKEQAEPAKTCRSLPPIKLVMQMHLRPIQSV